MAAHARNTAPFRKTSSPHKVVTVGHVAHNFVPRGPEKIRAFIELPDMTIPPADNEYLPSRQLEQWLDQGYRIVSAQTSGGGLDHGFYTVTTYVLAPPAE